MIRRPMRGSGSAMEPTVKSKPLAPPLKGYNARDPIASMDVLFARMLDNWFPSTNYAETRSGASYHAQNAGRPVKAVMGYTNPTSKKLWAATDIGIYDITASGNFGPAAKAVTNGEFCYTEFAAAGTTVLMAVNGVDDLQMYDGATWKSINGASVPAITGKATNLLNNVWIWKRRMFFVEKNSTSAWYLPSNVFAGALTELPLGQLFKNGGKLLAGCTWTVDGGNGPDDYCVFLSSEGEVAVFQGVDPSSATDWSLVGTFQLGIPVGRKSLQKFGGDVLLTTSVGLQPLSKSLLAASINKDSAITNLIDLVISTAVDSYGLNYGWETIVFPQANCLLLNVPTTPYTAARQLVMNTITGAWCTFSNWNAVCWEYWDGNLYFGGPSYVAKAFDGTSDFGADIVAIAKQAFYSFGKGAQAQITMCQPIFLAEGPFNSSLTIDVDFADSTNSTIGSASSAASYFFDNPSALFDSAVWGADTEVFKNWEAPPNDAGIVHAVSLRVASKDVKVRWSATNCLYITGAVSL